jgi:hypothetical protein
MSNVGRIFLDGGTPIDHNGSGIDLGSSFTFKNEQDLDKKLWLNPDEAGTDLKYLLKVHQGEMSPALSRLALKAVTLPLFVREFYHEETTTETLADVHAIPQRNARLLDAYMDRIGESHIDQAMLKQAIDDVTVLQLVTRSLTTEAPDDIILLPAGPQEDHIDKPTSFTVLRRQSLGRALLFVSSVRPAAHLKTPELNAHRIHIHPRNLLSYGANRFDLAEALIAEQKGKAISTEDQDLVSSAEAYVKDKIVQHFDAKQPRS